MNNMQQYGASKNPPWARNPTGQSLPGMQQQMLNQGSMAGLGQGMIQYPQTQGVFQPNMIQQQTNMTMGMPQMKQNNVGMNPMGQIGQGQMFSQSGVVSYPAPRALNPNAFSNTPQSNQPPSNSQKQRVFTGTVTASHDYFGFVDEDIFFQRRVCVKGENPVVGDKVLVEATYNDNMPFKWNATRIQVLPTNKSVSQSSRDNNMNSNKSPYNNVPPPNDNQSNSFNSNMSYNKWNSGNKNASPRDSGRSNITPNKTPYNNAMLSTNDSQSNTYDSKNRNRKLTSGGRENRRNRRSEEPKRDEIERPRRETREREERPLEERGGGKEVVGRERGERRPRSPSPARTDKRKKSRPVARYAVRVPKIALDIPEANVLEVRRRYVNLYIPSDFFNTQFRWIDAFPPDSPFPLYNPSCFHVIPKDVECPIVDKDAVLEPSDMDYSFSAKVMLLSIPHIDEVYKKCCNLESDDRDYVHPTRLISFLVGLRNKNETMAIGGPWSPSLDGENPGTDPNTLIKTAIRTCKALTGIDLSECTQWYRFMELYYRRAESVQRGKVIPARVETVVIFVPDIWSCLPTRSEWEKQHNSFKLLLEPTPASSTNQQDQGDKIATNASGKKEPTPFNELDPKNMSVGDLRKELEARNISSKGLLKSQLIAKLGKELKKEEGAKGSGEGMEVEEEGEPQPQEVIAIDDETQEDEDEKAKQEKEKALAKIKNSLPENPHILVHPSKTAKSGKFDCTVMTLSLLLDYRQEDSKEHSFEVSLFAELFNEMLMRDFGFNIYKALYTLPEKAKEEKKDGKGEGKDGKGDGKDGKGDGKDGKGEGKEGDKDKKDDRSRKDRDDTSVDDENSNDRKYGEGRRDKKDKVKMITKDPNLLLSFVYFDTTHCGYIFEKDIEELLFTLGLNLSRSQVKKLVAKVVNRDSFHYRQLTDKPKDEEDATKKAEVDPPNIDLSELAAGNKSLLPVFRFREEGVEPPNKKPKVDDENQMIMYKGRLFDIDKLLAQLKRSEQSRLETEARLSDLKTDNTRLQEKLTKAQSTSSTLSHDLSSNKKKLAEVQTQLSKNAMCTKIFLAALKDIDVKVQSVIHTNLYDENKIESSSSRWNEQESKKDVIVIDSEKSSHRTSDSEECKKDNHHSGNANGSNNANSSSGVIVIDGDKVEIDVTADDATDSKSTQGGDAKQ